MVFSIIILSVVDLLLLALFILFLFSVLELHKSIKSDYEDKIWNNLCDLEEVIYELKEIILENKKKES